LEQGQDDATGLGLPRRSDDPETRVVEGPYLSEFRAGLPFLLEIRARFNLFKDTGWDMKTKIDSRCFDQQKTWGIEINTDSYSIREPSR